MDSSVVEHVTNDFRDIYRCTQCDMSFRMKRLFQRHMAIHSNGGKVVDTNSEYIQWDYTNLVAPRGNIPSSASKNGYEVDNPGVNGIQVSQKTNLNQRNENGSQADDASINSVDMDFYFCNMCAKEFSDSVKLREHLRHEHDYEVSDGDSDGEFINGKLESHANRESDSNGTVKAVVRKRHTSRGDKLRSSTSGSMTMVTGEIKNIHYSNDPRPQKYACDFCDLRYRTPRSLYRHRRAKHRIENPETRGEASPRPHVDIVNKRDGGRGGGTLGGSASSSSLVTYDLDTFVSRISGGAEGSSAGEGGEDGGGGDECGEMAGTGDDDADDGGCGDSLGITVTAGAAAEEAGEGAVSESDVFVCPDFETPPSLGSGATGSADQDGGHSPVTPFEQTSGGGGGRTAGPAAILRRRAWYERFMCDTCGCGFDRAKRLEAHQQAGRCANTQATCATCGRRFTSRTALRLHEVRSRCKAPNNGASTAAPLAPSNSSSSPPSDGGAGTTQLMDDADAEPLATAGSRIVWGEPLDWLNPTHGALANDAVASTKLSPAALLPLVPPPALSSPKLTSSDVRRMSLSPTRRGDAAKPTIIVSMLPQARSQCCYCATIFDSQQECSDHRAVCVSNPTRTATTTVDNSTTVILKIEATVTRSRSNSSASSSRGIPAILENGNPVVTRARSSSSVSSSSSAMADEYRSPSRTCKKCDTSFATLASYRLHRINNCLSARSGLTKRQHKKRRVLAKAVRPGVVAGHKPRPKYPCPLCNHNLGNVFNLRRHLTTCTGCVADSGGDSDCVIVDSATKLESTPRDAQVVHDVCRTAKYECSYCHRNLGNTYNLRRHVAICGSRSHKTGALIEAVSSTTTTSTTRTVSNIFTDLAAVVNGSENTERVSSVTALGGSAQGPWSCRACSDVFDSLFALFDHMSANPSHEEILHNTETVDLDTVESLEVQEGNADEFPLRSGRHGAASTHSRMRNFACVCGHRLLSRRSLDHHKRYHCKANKNVKRRGRLGHVSATPDFRQDIDVKIEAPAIAIEPTKVTVDEVVEGDTISSKGPTSKKRVCCKHCGKSLSGYSSRFIHTRRHCPALKLKLGHRTKSGFKDKSSIRDRSLHRCKCCGATFRSHQSYGGHVRFCRARHPILSPTVVEILPSTAPPSTVIRLGHEASVKASVQEHVAPSALSPSGNVLTSEAASAESIHCQIASPLKNVNIVPTLDLECVDCGKAFFSPHLLAVHRLEWHPPSEPIDDADAVCGSGFRCHLCDDDHTFVRRVDLLFHVARFHATYTKRGAGNVVSPTARGCSKPCVFCGDSLNEGEYESHECSHLTATALATYTSESAAASPRPHTHFGNLGCGVCGKHFIWFSRLEKHRRLFHSDRCGSEESRFPPSRLRELLPQLQKDVCGSKLDT